MTMATGINQTNLNNRFDLEFIANLIEPRSRVLDLGCGDGSLLKLLVDQKQVTGRGVEISNEGIRECVRKGLTVYHGDLDEGLDDYPDRSFDYVILSQTLQTVHKPFLVLEEMLRVGRIGIVSFPNFGYWKVRWQLAVTGRMPKTDLLPYEWYDTPNIHLLTTKDFLAFCSVHGFEIDRAFYFTDKKPVKMLPNLLARLAVFVVSKR